MPTRVPTPLKRKINIMSVWKRCIHCSSAQVWRFRFTWHLLSSPAFAVEQITLSLRVLSHNTYMYNQLCVTDCPVNGWKFVLLACDVRVQMWNSLHSNYVSRILLVCGRCIWQNARRQCWVVVESQPPWLYARQWLEEAIFDCAQRLRGCSGDF